VLDAAGGGPSGTREQELASLEDDSVLSEVVRRLVKEFRPQRVYLFGSRARGDARDDSDYDLMLVVEEPAGAPWEMERRAYDVLSGLSISKDVVVMTSEYFDWMFGAAASLPSTVRREGRLLYAA
jgi:predicted nucleotidyltransferase